MSQGSHCQGAEDDFVPPRAAQQLQELVSNEEYVMYHGTTRARGEGILASGFSQSPDGMLGCGVYLSRDLEKARRYPINHPEHDKVVIKVSVNVGKVIAINRQNHPYQKTWHDYGYDTAWVPPNCGMVRSGLEENCVWDPTRIKILQAIRPTSTQNSPGYGAHGYTDSNMSQGSHCQCAEDDFVPPRAAQQLQELVSNEEYVMYHGTTRARGEGILASGFSQSPDGMLGHGVYLSRDLEKARRYPIDHPEHDKVVIKVSVNVGKVIVINRQNHPYKKTWHDYGYDTAWVPPNCGMVRSGLEENCVWDPTRIKILQAIRPTSTQNSPGYGAHGYTDNNMSQRSQYQGAQDDSLPPWAAQLLQELFNDKTYVMYHGTTRAKADSIMASGFSQSPDGMLGRGVYLSRDLEKASRYPIGHPEHDKVVIQVSVNVGKVIVVNRQKHPYQKTWHDYGYDTAWVPPNCGMVKSGLEENCVWDPTRIKIQKVIRSTSTQYSSG